MRRYGMLLLVMCLAVTSLLAAAAYSTATITNAATFKIVNTDLALLAIKKNTTDKDDFFAIVGGEMVLNFAKGMGGSEYGFQPNSEYAFNNIFKILNDSENNIFVWYTLDGDLLNWYNAGQLHIGCEAQRLWKLFGNGTAQPNGPSGEIAYEVLTVTGGGFSVGNAHWAGPISFFFEIPSGAALGLRSGNIYIHASTANPYGALPWHP